MKYFKNTELAKIYNVSEKSIRNWIQAALEGKNNLELYEKNEKFWIANTSKNTALIEEQAAKGKKYKNSRALKVIKPTKEFYESYTQRQILDIISNITINREIPTQYSYVDGGAFYWDRYANRLNQEKTPNVLNRTLELLHTSSDAISSFMGKTKKINIVDLGPGNGLPIRPLIRQIIDQNRLNKYIAIDSSPEMLNILRGNIGEWFGGKVKFEGHDLDFSCQKFDHLFDTDRINDDKEVPTNVICLLGGTLSNFKSPDQTLQTIAQSMGVNDILVYTAYLDTPSTRRYFDFNTTQPNQKLRTELILSKLGIKEDQYQIELGFDESSRARYMHVKPKMDICIEFEFPVGTRRVELAKNEPLLLWRHWHRTSLEMINQFDQKDLSLLHATKSTDQQYLLSISKLKTNAP